MVTVVIITRRFAVAEKSTVFLWKVVVILNKDITQKPLTTDHGNLTTETALVLYVGTFYQMVHINTEH